MRPPAPALVLLLAACGYQPSPQADTGKPAYAADLDSCRGSAADAVDARNAKTGLAWFSAPVRRWGQIEEGVQACMAAKGYGRLRWCSEDELRAGAKSDKVVVTAAGIRCSEPPERRPG